MFQCHLINSWCSGTWSPSINWRWCYLPHNVVVWVKWDNVCCTADSSNPEAMFRVHRAPHCLAQIPVVPPTTCITPCRLLIFSVTQLPDLWNGYNHPSYLSVIIRSKWIPEQCLERCKANLSDWYCFIILVFLPLSSLRSHPIFWNLQLPLTILCSLRAHCCLFSHRQIIEEIQNEESRCQIHFFFKNVLSIFKLSQCFFLTSVLVI